MRGRVRKLLLGVMACAVALAARAATPTEDELKAVFVFHFSNFVQWPREAYAAPAQTFDICLLGADELAGHLNEAIAGESVEGLPLRTRRIGSAEEGGDCRILYIGRDEAARAGRVAERANRRGTLTVSDHEGMAERGVMIQLTNENNRIRLLINVEEARAAGLQISSNLLRPARIVRTGRRE